MKSIFGSGFHFMNSLANAPSLKEKFDSISRKCFAGMQSETALALTAPYHVEELEALEKYLTKQAENGAPFDNFVAIGCGNLRYMDVALRFCKTYTAVEPNLRERIDEGQQAYLEAHSGIRILSKGFEDVQREDLPEGKTLYFFLFNVFPYIDDALAAQKRLVGAGDGVIISAWNADNFEARRLQKTYYDYLTEAYACTLVKSSLNGYIETVERESAGFCSGAERVKGRMTDILALKV